MNLNDFENFVEQKILDRGRDYFESGRVLSVEETGDNEYEAKVEGTERYTVNIELDGKGNVIDTVCDCPYDQGEYCKHQVAAMMALREMKSGSRDQNGGPIPRPAEARSKSAGRKAKKKPDLRKILEERTKAELAGFLLKLAAEDEGIGRRVELEFSGGSGEEEIRRSVQLIRAYIGRNSDRQGFVDYKNAYGAAEGAGFVLEKARAALREKKNVQALDLALCVVHEMIALLESADDSDGFIGGEIDEAFGLMGDITKTEGLNPDDRKIIFKKLSEEAKDRRYQGWPDWKLQFLACCSMLAETQSLRGACEKLLDRTARDANGRSWSSDYLMEQISLIRYGMIARNDGPGKAREFIGRNLKYPGFRKMAIENAMEEKDYDAAERLALEGEKLDRENRGLVERWMEYRYAAYRGAGNLEKQRSVAMEFVLRGSFEYYGKLKRTYRADDWSSVYPQILSRLENQKETCFYSDLYPRILVEEAEKQKLYEYVKRRPSEITSYYRYLMPEFKKEVYKLFLQHIGEAAADSGSRKEYQRVCAIIRLLKKAGGKEQAAQIKQRLLMLYPRKPAFRDELSKV